MYRFVIASSGLALSTSALAQLSDVSLVENSFRWSTYPSSIGQGCPDWVMTGRIAANCSFFIGCGADVASEENGPRSLKYSLLASYDIDVFTGEQPNSSSRLTLVLSRKIGAQIQIDLSHAAEPGGARGSSLAEIKADKDTFSAGPATYSSMGNYSQNLPGQLEDGWKTLPDAERTWRNLTWTQTGSQWKTRVTVYADRSHVNAFADSPAPAGALVRSIATAKSHRAYKSHSIVTPTDQWSGTLTLSGYEGERDLILDAVYCNSAGTQVISTGQCDIGPDGKFFLGWVHPNGTYDIFVRVRGFLWKKFNDVVVSDGKLSGLNATLVNGDIDGDNTIDIGDYALISDNLGLDESSTTWTRMNEKFVTPQDCDINGDGVVDVGDYAIVSTNFNMAGD